MTKDFKIKMYQICGEYKLIVIVVQNRESLQLPLSLINGEALSRRQTVKYLGVHFNSNLTWSTHIDSVFTKSLKIFFLSEGSVQ